MNTKFHGPLTLPVRRQSPALDGGALSPVGERDGVGFYQFFVSL
jgi:hypothetical protein